MAFHRWMYRAGRPNRVAKIMNHFWAALHSLGVKPNYFVTLEVPGRKSGKIISFPLAMLIYQDGRYLVSMLGNEANWVQNVKANGWRAQLRHGRLEQVTLVEVEPGLRAPILKAYLQIAPGARPHVNVNRHAPLPEFEKVAHDYPVFRVETD